MKKLILLIPFALLTGCMWETQNRVFPKPVFVFSRAAKEYRQEQRESEHTYEMLTNKVTRPK